MVKIVYFDELAATDFLTIQDGGISKQIIENIGKNKKNIGAGVEGSAGVKLALLSFFRVGVEANANANIEKVNSNVVKTTISNTLLSDFLSKIDSDDNNFKLIENFKLEAYPWSIAFFKMFTPYLKMFSGDTAIDENVTFDMSKMDEAFEHGKGYYEMIAKNMLNNEEEFILRFNINAFRNSYSISDLTKMDLTYVIIKVGKSQKNLLDINQEFNFKEEPLSYDKIKNKENELDKDLLDVYDVLLAGVNINGN